MRLSARWCTCRTTQTRNRARRRRSRGIARPAERRTSRGTAVGTTSIMPCNIDPRLVDGVGQAAAAGLRWRCTLSVVVAQLHAVAGWGDPKREGGTQWQTHVTQIGTPIMTRGVLRPQPRIWTASASSCDRRARTRSAVSNLGHVRNGRVRHQGCGGGRGGGARLSARARC